MNFQLEQSIEVLSRTPVVIEDLLSGISEDWTQHNEGENTWSPYNIVGHLIHGEKTDWIPRALLILSKSSDKSFKPFDRFAQMNEAEDIPMKKLLEEFKILRFQNLEILKSLNIDETSLSMVGIHPEFGNVNLKQLLSTWVAHDLGHLAQISRVMAKQYKSEVGPWVKYLRILQA